MSKIKRNKQKRGLPSNPNSGLPGHYFRSRVRRLNGRGGGARFLETGCDGKTHLLFFCIFFLALRFDFFRFIKQLNT